MQLKTRPELTPAKQMLLFHLWFMLHFLAYWTFSLKAAMVITGMSFETWNGKDPTITIIEFEGTKIMT